MRGINPTLFSKGYDSASIEKDDIKIINQLLKSSDTHKAGSQQKVKNILPLGSLNLNEENRYFLTGYYYVLYVFLLPLDC